MSLAENETCTGKCQHHRATETVSWSDSTIEVPVDTLIYAIQHGHLNCDTVNRIKKLPVIVTREFMLSIISETVSDSTRFQIGSIVHK